MKATIGIIGDGVMGRSVAQHLAEQDVTVALLGRHEEKLTHLKERGIIATTNQSAFLSSLESFTIFLFLPWSEETSTFVQELARLLPHHSTIVDFANAEHTESLGLHNAIEALGHTYIACAISGGEEGALHGASLMASGDKHAYSKIEPTLALLAAKDSTGKPTLAHFGPGTEGHFVKTLHNTIEYTLLDCLGSLVHLCRYGCNMESTAIADLFEHSGFESYLTDLLINVLRTTENAAPLWEKVSPRSESKGTGIWGVEYSLEEKRPALGAIGSLASRFVSQQQDIQEQKIFQYSLSANIQNDWKHILDTIYTLAFAEILDIVCAYNKTSSHQIQIHDMLRVWEGGCIIRWNELDTLRKTIGTSTAISSVLPLIYAEDTLPKSVQDLADLHITTGIPAPSFFGLTQYFALKKSPLLHTNVIQAMRDSFGAHTYTRIDKPGVFHSTWTS